ASSSSAGSDSPPAPSRASPPSRRTGCAMPCATGGAASRKISARRPITGSTTAVRPASPASTWGCGPRGAERPRRLVRQPPATSSAVIRVIAEGSVCGLGRVAGADQPVTGLRRVRIMIPVVVAKVVPARDLHVAVVAGQRERLPQVTGLLALADPALPDAGTRIALL